MIPARLLPHVVTIVTPAAGSADPHGAAATRTEVAAWVEQQSRSEAATVLRDGREQGWLLVTNHLAVTALDRVEWDGRTWEVDGPPRPVHTPASTAAHHLEADLRLWEG